MVETYRPTKLADALEIRRSGAMPFGGGTDLMVRHRSKNGMDAKIPGPLLFVDNIRELKTLCIDGDELCIGASLPVSILADDPGERRAFASGDSRSLEALEAIPAVLAASARDLGAPALRQRATAAGNLANASPAGDIVAALYSLNARVELASASSGRLLQVSDFIRAPGKTQLADDEIITAIRIPLLASGRPGDWTYWRKVGTRRANALTKVSIAVAARMEKGCFTSLRMAFGAVGPTVICPDAIQEYFIGRSSKELSEGLETFDGASTEGSGIPVADVLDSVRQSVMPIDDQRSTAHYRKTIAVNLSYEALTVLSEYI